MRGALPPVLVWLLCGAAVAQTVPPRRPAALAPKAAPAPLAVPVIGCPSLANLRRLLREAKDDQAAALAVLANEHADHLGCGLVPRERVATLADHVALGGRSYDCLGLRDTAVCHWTLAGAVAPPDPAPASRPAAPAPDKTRR